eukprot:scaffold19922_cov120-Isochrysis_galbana.AAC.1
MPARPKHHLHRSFAPVLLCASARRDARAHAATRSAIDTPTPQPRHSSRPVSHPASATHWPALSHARRRRREFDRRKGAAPTAGAARLPRPCMGAGAAWGGVKGGPADRAALGSSSEWGAVGSQTGTNHQGQRGGDMGGWDGGVAAPRRSRRGTQASVSAELARVHSRMSFCSPSAVCVFLSAVSQSLRLRPPGQHITHHTTALTAHRNRPPYQTSQPCADALLRPKSKEEQKGEPSDPQFPHLDN